ncbi:uncharacterized protein [Diabrotica undecimpunctata]|uniref:uncharacterized protein n=1 Tax=Diabrotica undecimpunctata TaxID=50387 RepID=UPI003B63464B
MIGKGRKLVDFMQRRRICVLCMQEIRWKDYKSRDLGDGCKLKYSSSNSHGRDGVGTILNNECKEHLVRVTKEEFWRNLDCEMFEIPVDEKCLIGGDLNGHIGTEKAGIEIVYKGLGVGIRNDKRNILIDIVVA